MALSVDSVGGEPLGRDRGRVVCHPAGRVCEEHGCRTRLSVYNSRPKCALHDFDGTLMNFRSPVLAEDVTRRPVTGRPSKARAA